MKLLAPNIAAKFASVTFGEVEKMVGQLESTGVLLLLYEVNSFSALPHFHRVAPRVAESLTFTKAIFSPRAEDFV